MSGQNETAEPASSRPKGIYGWSLLPGDTTFYATRHFMQISSGRSRGKSRESETPILGFKYLSCFENTKLRFFLAKQKNLRKS
jgi:hypothetical protein